MSDEVRSLIETMVPVVRERLTAELARADSGDAAAIRDALASEDLLRIHAAQTIVDEIDGVPRRRRVAQDEKELRAGGKSAEPRKPQPTVDPEAGLIELVQNARSKEIRWDSIARAVGTSESYAVQRFGERREAYAAGNAERKIRARDELMEAAGWEVANRPLRKDAPARKEALYSARPMVELRGMSTAEAAAELGESDQTLRNRIQRLTDAGLPLEGIVEWASRATGETTTERPTENPRKWMVRVLDPQQLSDAAISARMEEALKRTRSES